MPKIEFHYEDEFRLKNDRDYLSWIERIILSENHRLGDINFIFCNDEYLSGLHQQFLDNEDFTDIITFDYVENDLMAGDIFISVERVRENALTFEVSFDNELKRVMSHGLLHLMGYKDKSEEDILLMRRKENEKIEMFHVEQ